MNLIILKIKDILFVIIFIFSNLIGHSQTSNYLSERNEAINLIMNKQYEKALVKINKSIKLKENEADSYYVRGNAYQAKRQLESAKEDYLKAIKLKSNHTDALSKCAIIYGMQKDMVNFCYYASKACNFGAHEMCNMSNKFCN